MDSANIDEVIGLETAKKDNQRNRKENLESIEEMKEVGFEKEVSTESNGTEKSS